MVEHIDATEPRPQYGNISPLQNQYQLLMKNGLGLFNPNDAGQNIFGEAYSISLSLFDDQ